MRHLPFLKALASATDTSDPIWRDTAGGYLVLRLFDRWLEEGQAVVVGDPGLASLQSRIRAIPATEPTVQDLLLTAVHVMSEAPRADPTLVSEQLLVYGKYLESAGWPALAAHVYETLITALDSPHGTDDPLAAVQAHLQYGYVMRFLGQFDAAHDAYHRAEALAQGAGAVVLAVRARMGQANTLKARGNLGEAEALLDRILADATEGGLTNARSWALHSRGGVRALRGRHVEAMRDMFQAYELTDDGTEREFILGDIAACASEAGYWHMARDAYRVLAYTARTPNVRLTALANLLERAALAGDAAEFSRMQKHIQLHAQRHPVPVEYTIHIQLYTAYGTERFGSREEAIEAYRVVMTQAHDAGLHQVAFTAERALDALMTGAREEAVIPPEPPEALRHILEAIAEWSELASTAS